MKFLPVNATALLVELPDLSQTLTLLHTLQTAHITGITEVVPAACTLLVRFEAWHWNARSLAERIRQLGANAQTGHSHAGELIRIPVRYDGEDLSAVAAHLGLDESQVIARHCAQPWQVAFTGFAPGFAYLSDGDSVFNVPRRSSPRTRIPPGAVALAGRFSGIYPRASPGGWQLIGQTDVPMWDLQRTPPALLQPGQRVQFVDMATSAGRELHAYWQQHIHPRVAVAMPGMSTSDATSAKMPKSGALDADTAITLEVVQTGLQALVQDLGRPGQAGQGVSISGALDRSAFIAANQLVGNRHNAPALELLHGGFSLRAHGHAVVAVTGADGSLTLCDHSGACMPAARYAPLALEAGDTLTVGIPEAGLRSYLAVRGGLAITPILDSCATDTLAGIGPDALQNGQILRIGHHDDQHPGWHTGSVAAHADHALPHLPRQGVTPDTVWLDITLGPRHEWFSPQSLQHLLEQPWQVTQQSNRVGLRLQGAYPLERAPAFAGAELPSEGTVWGSLQVPANGQPVLFMADHPLTGGYPVIACVAQHHLDLAAQLPAGVQVRFRALPPIPLDM